MSIHAPRGVARRRYVEREYPFPLRPIRDSADYDRAAAALDGLVLRGDLTHDERDYLAVLTLIVRAYDDHFWPVSADRRSPLARLKSLMDTSGTTPATLGDIIGSRPAASMVLSGRRELSKAHIRKLADHFKMSPAFFF